MGKPRFLKLREKISKTSSLVCINPFLVIISSRLIQGCIASYGVYLLFDCVATCVGLADYGKASYRELRVESELYNHSDQVEFKLLLGGCPRFSLTRAGNLTHREGADHGVLESNGYAVLRKDVDPSSSRGPFGFRIEGYSPTENRWFIVGTCRVRFLNAGPRFLQGPCASPPAGQLSFDLRAPWPLKVALAAEFILALCALGMGLLGALEAAHLAMAALKAALASIALLLFVAGAGFLSMPTGRAEAPLHLIYAATCCLSLAALHIAERRLAEAAAAAGCLALAARLATDCGAGDCARLSQVPPIEQLALASAGAALLVYVRRVAQGIRRAAQGDQAKYDAAWRRLLEAGASADLRLLQDQAAEAAAACSASPARHLEAAASQLVFKGPSSTGDLPLPGDAAASGGLGRSGVSLHEAYVQAAALVSLLAQRCQAWAAAAGGGCKLWQCGPAWGLEDEVLAEALGEGAAEWARRGWLKRHARAVEKLASRYGGDASRLVDLCRGRVECRAASDASACLAAIRADPEVEVVRVRDRMAAAGDADDCAGFRVSMAG